MTPKKLDDEIIKGGVVETAPHDVKKIDEEEIVYIPGKILSDVLHRLEPMHASSLTKTDLLKQTKENVKLQMDNRGIQLIPFNQVEYQKMLKELDSLCDNEEGWTKEAWEWQRNRIIANFLDRTGLSSPEIYPHGRILSKTGEVATRTEKNYVRDSTGLHNKLKEKTTYKQPSIAIHEQKGSLTRYTYERMNSLRKTDGLLF